MHHFGVFVMQVEEIDLVREHDAVEAAFLDQHDVIAVAERVDRGRADAARGGLLHMMTVWMPSCVRCAASGVP